MLFSIVCLQNCFATPNGFYLGAGGGFARSNIGANDTIPKATSVDNSAAGYKADAGYQWNHYFATEINYIYFGRVHYTSLNPAANGSVNTQAVLADIVGIIPFDEDFSFQAKLGAFYASRNRSKSLVFNPNHNHGSEGGLDFGLGFQYNFIPELALSVNYDQLIRSPDDSLISLNLTYYFNAFCPNLIQCNQSNAKSDFNYGKMP